MWKFSDNDNVNGNIFIPYDRNNKQYTSLNISIMTSRL